MIEVYHSRFGHTLIIDGWVGAFQTTFRGIIEGIRAAYEMDLIRGIPTLETVSWTESTDEGRIEHAFPLLAFLRPTRVADLVRLVNDTFYG